ncbi:hypothetical protein CMUS01_08641 [Colletotrichum musicola]|uniref:Uncharacterized protein n=1 Tax=Colletotrichum musicola TaxID=2175873 RepID=A0A8H6KCM8_9PEZI|nr:hypothetical protein CMUS01_08641 [Colletotrichum musicola]
MAPAQLNLYPCCSACHLDDRADSDIIPYVRVRLRFTSNTSDAAAALNLDRHQLQTSSPYTDHCDSEASPVALE